ncbi:MAG: SPFH domain-containing protein [Oceanospirillaceae bacterium]|nr:SPFH domain-containing protein [Oceanospirillaceae bacterium]MCP5349884.1 SPFH domain-containing protein [Oceanospirillaceae bacterium]
MMNIRYYKAEPTTYVFRYRKGVVKQKGPGLSFIYFEPGSTLVAVPMATQETPFIMKETTSDYQEVTVQGQLVYRISDPEKSSAMMNFSLNKMANGYVSDDPIKLSNRVLNLAQVIARAKIQSYTLQQALGASLQLVEAVSDELSGSPLLERLGVEIVDLSIQAIRPAPETARALETSAREELLKKADEAIYARRKSAIEQERIIKESELSTELAVEAKKRQISESKIEAERSMQEKRRQIQQEQMNADVELEAKRKELVEMATENEKKQGDAKAYSIEKMMLALSKLEPALVEAIASTGMEPERVIAQAFKGLATNANKIGQLNITPDLLSGLMKKER